MLEIDTIVQGDCLQVMKDIPDKSIDLVLTDPPYNISKKNDRRDRSKLNSPIMRSKKELNYDFGEWDNRNRDDFILFTNIWLGETIRVLKNGGTIISFFSKDDISHLGYEAKKYDVRTRTIISWHKTNPVPSFRKVNYLSACEFIWIGSVGTKTWTFNFQKQSEMHNFFETSNGSSYKQTSHPTEKPESLLEWLITIHSNENDLILDPFLGSGTTVVACVNLKRHFIGIELSQQYVDIANKRVADAIYARDSQPELQLTGG